jgi:uncharacterized protein
MRHAYCGRGLVSYACLFLLLFYLNNFAIRNVSAAESPSLDTIQTDQATEIGVKDSFDDAVQAVKDRNFQRAIQLFSKLSQIVQYDGQYEAQFNLAVLLKQGKGRPQNYAEALYWARRAELGGIDKSKDFADSLSDLVTEDQHNEILARIKTALLKEVDQGAIESLPQLATYHISLLDDNDYEQAYLWFALGAALDLPEQDINRTEMEDELETEQIATLQGETTKLFDALLAGESLEDLLRPVAKE